MVTTFAVLVGTSLSTRAQRVASSPSRICSMNISAYVKEINADGEEVILDFAQHPELNQTAWGIYDKRRSNSQPIQFNQGSLAQYQVFTTDRSFLAFPEDNEIYNAGEKSFATLSYENTRYELTRKEVKVCQKEDSTNWLCTDSTTKNKESENTDQGIETISNLYIDCGVKLEFGWVVKPIEQGFSDHTSKAINKAADINHDFAYNTLDLLAVINGYSEHGENLKADVNQDKVINALDYTLVVEAIESQ
jgi:hypothetical protein